MNYRKLKDYNEAYDLWNKGSQIFVRNNDGAYIKAEAADNVDPQRWLIKDWVNSPCKVFGDIFFEGTTEAFEIPVDEALARFARGEPVEISTGFVWHKLIGTNSLKSYRLTGNYRFRVPAIKPTYKNIMIRVPTDANIPDEVVVIPKDEVGNFGGKAVNGTIVK